VGEADHQFVTERQGGGPSPVVGHGAEWRGPRRYNRKQVSEFFTG
jgi:hypothetical protein